MIQGIEDQKSDAGLPAEGFLYLDPASYQFRKERGIAMFGFLTFGTTLALTDLAVKKEIEARPDEEFPKTVKESGGLIRLYKNHNPGFSFGFMKESPKLVEMVPVWHAVGGSRCMGVCDWKERTCAGEDGADPGAGRRREQPL